MRILIVKTYSAAMFVHWFSFQFLMDCCLLFSSVKMNGAQSTKTNFPKRVFKPMKWTSNYRYFKLNEYVRREFFLFVSFRRVVCYLHFEILLCVRVFGVIVVGLLLLNSDDLRIILDSCWRYYLLNVCTRYIRRTRRWIIGSNHRAKYNEHIHVRERNQQIIY